MLCWTGRPRCCKQLQSVTELGASQERLCPLLRKFCLLSFHIIRASMLFGSIYGGKPAVAIAIAGDQIQTDAEKSECDSRKAVCQPHS